MSTELEHAGVKGMKWGVRRTDAELDAAANRRAERKEARVEKREDKRQLKLHKANQKFDQEDRQARKDIEAFGGRKGVAATTQIGGSIVGGMLVGAIGSNVASSISKSNPGAAVAIGLGSSAVAWTIAVTGTIRGINTATVDNGYRQNFDEVNRVDRARGAAVANRGRG